MNLAFLHLSEAERRLYIDQAAARRDISSILLEKDFWVCWMLGVLFNSKFAESLVFKGGTSLSKVFGAIERFSEDIDLSLSPAFLNLPAAGASRNQAHKWMQRAERACTAAVREQVHPAIAADVQRVLGVRRGGWIEFITDLHTNSPVLLFHYPSAQPAGLSYLHRSIKLEFGSLTDQQPAGKHAIQPWLAEVFPEVFADWHCTVVALEVERTFWEKATILHAEFHRPAEKRTPDRFARHYADMSALALHPAAGNAVELEDLCRRVAKWKGRFFGSSCRTMRQPCPARFVWSHRPNANRHYGATIKLCTICIFPNLLVSMRFYRRFRIWRLA